MSAPVPPDAPAPAPTPAAPPSGGGARARRLRWWGLAFVLLGLAAGAAWWVPGAPTRSSALSPTSAPTTAAPKTAATSAHALRPDDPAVVARGASLYAQQCAACHGARGEGQPDWRERGPTGLMPAPPHDASGHTWHHPDEQLFDITKRGLAAVLGQPDYRTAMPAYAGVLSDDDIVAVLSYIKAQWPANVRADHDKVNAQARAAAR